MSPLAQFEVEDLKRVYRALHGQLLERTELMDSPLVHELQRYLQLRARGEGVDLADHASWDQWLASGQHRAAADRPRRITRRETD